MDLVLGRNDLKSMNLADIHLCPNDLPRLRVSSEEVSLSPAVLDDGKRSKADCVEAVAMTPELLHLYEFGNRELVEMKQFRSHGDCFNTVSL